MRNINLLWVGLIAATLLSELLAGGRSFGIVPPPVPIILLYAVALTKVRFVILDMMEVRTAPLAVRLVMETWVGATWIGLSVLRLIQT